MITPPPGFALALFPKETFPTALYERAGSQRAQTGIFLALKCKGRAMTSSVWDGSHPEATVSPSTQGSAAAGDQ